MTLRLSKVLIFNKKIKFAAQSFGLLLDSKLINHFLLINMLNIGIDFHFIYQFVYTK